MNFSSVYNAILNKIQDESDLLKLLEKKIVSNPILAKQFVIYESLKQKNQTKEQAENLVQLSESYVSKFSFQEAQSANRELAWYFNIDIVNESSSIDNAIEEMLAYQGGGVTSLSPRYKEAIIESLMQSDKKDLNEATLTAIHEELRQSDLSLLESEIINIVRQNSFSKLEAKLSAITTLAESLALKDKFFVQECIKTIKERFDQQSLKEATYNTYDLYETVIDLLDRNKLSKEVNIKENGYLNNIKALLLKESNKAVINFTINFEPASNSYKTLNEATARLNKHLYFMGKQKFTTWDSLVLSEDIKLDDPVKCSGQLIIDLTEGLNSIDKTLEEVNNLLDKSFSNVLKK